MMILNRLAGLLGTVLGMVVRYAWKLIKWVHTTFYTAPHYCNFNQNLKMYETRALKAEGLWLEGSCKCGESRKVFVHLWNDEVPLKQPALRQWQIERLTYS